MQKPLLSALIALAPLSLAACGQPETITAGGVNDPTAGEIAAAPPVKLPPAMLASKQYRCKDNGLVFIDWFNDNMTASLKTSKDGAATALAAPAAGQPYVGGGYTLTGTAEASSISLTKPGGSTQACDA